MSFALVGVAAVGKAVKLTALVVDGLEVDAMRDETAYVAV
jgi:hypothetical protein